MERRFWKTSKGNLTHLPIIVLHLKKDSPHQDFPNQEKKEALVQVLADLGTIMEKIMTAPEVPSGGTTSDTHGHENLCLEVRILKEKYSTLLAENEYIDCLTILENERKALVFLEIHKNLSKTLKWFKKA
ncbi:hypothetical protein O181_110446 [Austropuccinia psidii MF-1]|uniref:Uncharacterized protein n=1 Tax=Austropuccinia psidii MF-1 TaxID=1389203 RepID=A0A9Q3JZ76_9BASI|nr:hypothetical protein [Austropuccinia psidii MF-1]